MENVEAGLEIISEFNQTLGDKEVTTLVSRPVFGYSIISYHELIQTGTTSVGNRLKFWGSLQIPNLPSNCILVFYKPTLEAKVTDVLMFSLIDPLEPIRVNDAEWPVFFFFFFFLVRFILEQFGFNGKKVCSYFCYYL